MEDRAIHAERLPRPTPARVDAGEMSTLGLMREVTTKSIQLVSKELELARSELRHDLQIELSTVKSLALAGVFSMVTLNLIVIAGAFALALVMPAWSATLVVAGATALLAILCGALGWNRRVRHPLAVTRRTLEEDLEWAKERMT